MRVLLLGGQNPRHAEWVRAFAGELESAGHATAFVDYQNWSEGGDTRVPHEMDVAAAITKEWGDFIVVGKSIGSVIAIEGIGRGLLKAGAAVLMGFPLTALTHDAEIRGAAGLLPPTIVFQNERDPFGSAQEVSAFFTEYGPAGCRVVTNFGHADHDYVDFPTLVGAVTALAEKISGESA